eukprot:TRINITY_DN1265_c0_g1_i1.p1 TRINITY_DN1265_c0_g1~~TRINITY_DN1265_c0_g1_i1.p1  ORF type:complete len:559 (-),score=94.40 TRINITY_DN1265_c0_g1_i1:27-1703(-)
MLCTLRSVASIRQSLPRFHGVRGGNGLHMFTGSGAVGTTLPVPFALARTGFAPSSHQRHHTQHARTYSTAPQDLEHHNHILTPDTINKRVLEAEYAVRGEMVLRALELKKELADPEQKAKLPFDEIVWCNIGNPHDLQQKPLTFFRQVLSLMEYPDILDNPAAAALYPIDAMERARQLLGALPGGVGAYSTSQGVELVRNHVAEFIAERDGFPADPADIFLTDGASAGVSKMLDIMIRDKKDATLVPIPQYPLYSATITLFGGSQINYYLDEDKNWALPVQNLKEILKQARSEGLNPRSMVIINPGNPTGQCLDRENISEVIDFCHQERLVIMADEVYQFNSYLKPFHSFKKVLRQMGPYYKDTELVSFHSTSKGVVGECGHRGGYMELIGIHPEVRQQIYKLASVSLCSNVPGQVAVDLMVNPPKAGDPSFSLYQKETQDIFDSLKQRADILVKALNQLEGVTCNSPEGAMYLMPQIRLPARAIEHARKEGKSPDLMYCLAMLQETGICTVPGAGFGQKSGTFHFRTTFLPPLSKIVSVSNRLHNFHRKFLETWSDK